MAATFRSVKVPAASDPKVTVSQGQNVRQAYGTASIPPAAAAHASLGTASQYASDGVRFIFYTAWDFLMSMLEKASTTPDPADRWARAQHTVLKLFFGSLCVVLLFQMAMILYKIMRPSPPRKRTGAR